MQDMNLRHNFARVEFVGHENAGPTCASVERCRFRNLPWCAADATRTCTNLDAPPSHVVAETSEDSQQCCTCVQDCYRRTSAPRQWMTCRATDARRSDTVATAVSLTAYCRAPVP